MTMPLPCVLYVVLLQRAGLNQGTGMDPGGAAI